MVEEIGTVAAGGSTDVGVVLRVKGVWDCGTRSRYVGVGSCEVD